jgi:hypothetical protein
MFVANMLRGYCEHESMGDGSDGRRDGPLRQREKPRGWTCKDPERSIRANQSGLLQLTDCVV